MYKVYLAINPLINKMLGYVNKEGVVYRSKTGLDDRLGKVELSTGKIVEDRFGPDKVTGRVDMKTGKVYLSRLGPDEYVGRVDVKGHFYKHVPMGTDRYLGHVDPFISYAHSAAAMVLLLLPALEEEAQDGSQDSDQEKGSTS
jgi:hypothetical protein